MTASTGLVKPVVMVLAIGIAAASAQAGDWYVDNLLGDDLFSGAVPEPVDRHSGPLRSIRAAVRRAQGADTIHLANRGIPYYESIELTGPRFRALGLSIEGNGAILSGATGIPHQAWRLEGDNLWKLIPRFKSHNQLILADRAVTESHGQSDWKDTPKIPLGSWCLWQGAVYYQARSEPGQSIDQLPLGLAARDVGISLHDVTEIQIRDLTIRHFRVDGINAHDRARNIVLENVRLLENGRSGLAVGGSSQVVMQGGELRGNRLAEVWNSEKGRTTLTGTSVTPGASPLSFRIAGGQVIVDDEEVFEDGD